MRELYAKFKEAGVTPDVVQFAEDVILPAEVQEDGGLLLEPPMSFAGLASDIRSVKLSVKINFSHILSFWEKQPNTTRQFCSTTQ